MGGGGIQTILWFRCLWAPNRRHTLASGIYYTTSAGLRVAASPRSHCTNTQLENVVVPEPDKRAMLLEGPYTQRAPDKLSPRVSSCDCMCVGVGGCVC